MEDRCMRYFKLIVPLSLLVMVAFGGLIFGQTQTGTITGRVTDETGAVLPGVTVTITSAALITGTNVTTTTEYGVYKFIALPPGSYDVKFELEGFRPIENKEIKISAYFVAKVDVVMSIAVLEEVLTVTGEAPAVDTTSNVSSTSFDKNLLEHIPSGRDLWVVAEQVPGVVMDRYNIGGTESAQQSSGFVHGSQSQQDYSINGLSLNWPGGPGSATSFYFDHDSFEEVQIQTSAAPAEIGVGGLYMNMITKSGGNEFHGAATFLYEPGKLQGNNVTDELRDQGIETANPIELIADFNANMGGPIIKNKMWFFTSYRRYIINTQMLGLTRPDGSPEVDINHQTNVLGKVTTQLNPNNKLMAQYYFNYQNRFYRRAGASFVEEKASTRQIEPCHIIQGQWTSIFFKDLFLDVRYGYKHLIFPMSYQPEVGPNDYCRVDDVRSTMTGAASYDMKNTATRHQFNAALSYFADYLLGGSHDFKFGFEYTNCLNGYDYKSNGDMVMHLEDGVPAYIVAWNTPVKQGSKYQTFAFYVQDSYTIGNRLTFNMGVRFEAFEGWNPAQSSPGGTFYSARSFSEVRNIPNFKNVVPRLGFSYDLFGDGRTALKGSFSRYTQLEGARFPENLNPNALGGDVRLWTDLNGDLFADLNELSAPVSFFGGVGVRLDPNLTRPLSDEASIGVEHQVGEDLALSATYYYRKNSNWMGRNNILASYTPVDIVAEGETITVHNQTPETIGLIDRVITNIPEFYEKYHGFELTAKKKFSNRWQLIAGYTRGQSKGYYVESRWGFSDSSDPNNRINIKDAYHPSDRTNIFKLIGTYFFPRDFTVSANYRYYTGDPLTRRYRVTGMNQGSFSVALEPRGTYRYPNVSILDIRASKIFHFSNFNLEAMFNLFNVFNASTTVSQITTVGPYYGTPSRILSPIIAGFGVRLTF